MAAACKNEAGGDVVSDANTVMMARSPRKWNRTGGGSWVVAVQQSVAVRTRTARTTTPRHITAVPRREPKGTRTMRQRRTPAPVSTQAPKRPRCGAACNLRCRPS